jgi:hypothetical protein
MKKYMRSKIGDICEIVLPNKMKAYARVLKSPLMAFYEIQSKHSLSAEQVLNYPIAFKVWVLSSAIKSGRWHIIGFVPLEPELEVMPWFFKQAIGSNALSLYRSDSYGEEYPASKEDCVGLERAAIWSAEHIESRLEDHFAGRPNKWVEMLQLKGTTGRS